MLSSTRYKTEEGKEQFVLRHCCAGPRARCSAPTDANKREGNVSPEGGGA